MSDNDSKAQGTQQKQSKGKAPSHDVYQVTGSGDNSQWHKIGAVWQGKENTLSGDTVHGRLVLKSREALKDIREQKQETAPENKQSQDPSM
ncbi:MAG: hypothetical protein MJK04_34880 [Psychrosphaera sp.]|nr:hypothetical protein [Psychrosphaera sp.]